MFDLSERMKVFLKGLLIFVLLVLFFYFTKISGSIILSIYLIGFWVYILFLDLKNRNSYHYNNEFFDNPSLLELDNFCRIWKLAKSISQSLGFILLISGFVIEKNIPAFMIMGTIFVGCSLLFDSILISDIKKIKELQIKERNN